MSTSHKSIVIIGGGILGMSTAMTLSNLYPRYKVTVLEKEDRLATHQTGHNSGVIHSGIYYRPGSLKAINCVSGAKDLIKFCDENNVEYDICGKLILATDQAEVPMLRELHRRGEANGVSGLKIVDGAGIQEVEPHCNGVLGLWSPNTGIVDYASVVEAYARQFRANGGTVLTNAKVTGISADTTQHTIVTSKQELQADYLINCAGLYADILAEEMGAPRDMQIIPFRGEYFFLKPTARALVKGLIYPVPNPEFPFLGVHFTRTIAGEVEAGPNAVFAFAREGYSISTIRIDEFFHTLAYRGFWKMARRYWRTGLMEFARSVNKGAFTKSLQRLVPEIQGEDLVPGGAGVRAQAVGVNGALVDDFLISETRNAIHVRNAPSPGATASIAIGRDIVNRAEVAFGLVK